MAVYTRDKLDSLIGDIRQDVPANVFLLFGERFLCQQAAEKLSLALVASGGNVHQIDGNQVNFASLLGKISSFNLFQGRQVYRVSDTKLFHSQKIAKSLWSRANRAHKENNRPQAGLYLRAMMETAGLDPADPDNSLADLSASQWKKSFSFTRPGESLAWTEDALQAEQIPEEQGAEPATADPDTLFEHTLTTGIPDQNFVILTTEDVDKRKKLYKYLKENHVVVDLSVEAGSSNRARKEQKSVLLETLNRTLAGMNKTMAPEVAEILFERVGFHPVAIAMEAEKLALFTGERKKITRDDLDELIGRTRQEALFELTEALGRQNLEKALIIAGRLQESGIHPLAIVATVRNYLRGLLLYRALQQQPEYGYSPGMSPGQFQQECLPRLKENEQWKKELSGHPYAVFMQFKAASALSLKKLKNWFSLTLEADFRLKGSPVAPDTVLQHLLISMLGNNRNATLQK